MYNATSSKRSFDCVQSPEFASAKRQHIRPEDRRKTKWMAEPRFSLMTHGIQLVRVHGVSVEAAAKYLGLPERSLRRYTEISQDPARADSVFYFPLRRGERVLKKSLRKRLESGGVSFNMPTPTAISVTPESTPEPTVLTSLQVLPRVTAPQRACLDAPTSIPRSVLEDMLPPEDDLLTLIASFEDEPVPPPRPFLRVYSSNSSLTSLSDLFSRTNGEQDWLDLMATPEVDQSLNSPALTRTFTPDLLGASKEHSTREEHTTFAEPKFPCFPGRGCSQGGTFEHTHNTQCVAV